MLGYRAIPELLRRNNLPVVFSMLGGTNVPWIGAGVEAGAIRLVRTRHETTAVTAAMGYSRASGLIGACSVTRGPGFTNGLTALVAAARNHVPILLIVAESPTRSARNSQQIDQRALAGIAGAGFHHASEGADIVTAFAAAISAARWNGCPQVLSVAERVLTDEVDLADGIGVAPETQRAAPDATLIAAAVDALAESNHPLILAGRGALLSDCRADLEELANLTGARVATTLLAPRFFSGHPGDLGLAGGYAPALARDYFAATDVLLAFGASLNAHTMDSGALFRDASVIRCDVDAGGGVPHHAGLSLVGDARATAKALSGEWRRRGLRQRPPLEPVMHHIRTSALEMSLGNGNGLDPREVMRRLDAGLPPDRIIVTDSGRTLPLMPSLIDARDAQSFIVGPGFGSIGLGLGTAIGAAVASSGRPTVLLIGDGAFMMTAHDLDAVRDAQINLTIVVFNDRQYGSEIRHLEHFDLPHDVAQMPPPDIVSLARAFGGDGVVVETERDLENVSAMKKGLWVIDARIDQAADAKVAFARKGD